jgi:hypothetical protein
VLVFEMLHAPTTVRHKNLFTERTVVHAPIQGIPLRAGHFLVDDIAAGVADVGPDAWVGG